MDIFNREIVYNPESLAQADVVLRDYHVDFNLNMVEHYPSGLRFDVRRFDGRNVKRVATEIDQLRAVVIFLNAGWPAPSEEGLNLLASHAIYVFWKEQEFYGVTHKRKG